MAKKNHELSHKKSKIKLIVIHEIIESDKIFVCPPDDLPLVDIMFILGFGAKVLIL